MLHDETRTIRGYIPNRNCKGIYIKGKRYRLLSTYIHIIHTCPQSMNILIPNAYATSERPDESAQKSDVFLYAQYIHTLKVFLPYCM